MELGVDSAERILVAYDAERVAYGDLALMVSKLLQTILSEAGIVLHSSTFRCKDRHSLAKKIGRPGKSYKTLSDVTDVAGIRLTTYFADDVDKIAGIIRDEFSIDESSSVDKRVQSDPDRFGYLSLHFIARLSDGRVELVEYRRFKGLRFEIQIRSILQHAWAEIEHDLGYKSASGVPAEVRRRFARVSGLLELADSEFCAIRDQLNSYEVNLPKIIQQDPEEKALDLPILKLLAASDDDVKRLDQEVVAGTGASIDSLDGFIMSRTLDKLIYLGVDSVGRLKGLAREHCQDVREFSAYWTGASLGSVDVGIGLFYLCYVLVWKGGSESAAIQYVEEFWGEDSHSRNAEIARSIVSYAAGLRLKRDSFEDDED